MRDQQILEQTNYLSVGINLLEHTWIAVTDSVNFYDVNDEYKVDVSFTCKI